MEGMYIVLGGVGIVACCLYLWSAFTKSGKKWIESLQGFSPVLGTAALRLADQSKVSPCCAGWDRMGIAVYSLQLIF